MTDNNTYNKEYQAKDIKGYQPREIENNKPVKPPKGGTGEVTRNNGKSSAKN